jgi:hypothetical protein
VQNALLCKLYSIDSYQQTLKKQTRKEFVEALTLDFFTLLEQTTIIHIITLSQIESSQVFHVLKYMLICKQVITHLHLIKLLADTLHILHTHSKE